jgi:hypothetical protein
MKFIKTNEEISLSNKKYISDYGELITKLSEKYTSEGWSVTKSDEKVLGRATLPKKDDIVKIETLKISNDEYELLLILALIKEGENRLKKFIATPNLLIDIDIYNKKTKKSSSNRAKFNLTKRDITVLSEKIKRSIDRTINNSNQRTERELAKIERELAISTFFEEYPEEEIREYLWDLIDFLDGEFRMTKLSGKGWLCTIITNKKFSNLVVYSKEFFEMNDDYVNTITQLNNTSKKLKNNGLDFKWSIEDFKKGIVNFIITDPEY